MAIRVEIEVDAEDAIRSLESMRLRATNFRPLFWYARTELQKSNAENFTANGLPSGERWEPRRGIYTWPLLRRSGRLFASLSMLRGAPNEINRMDAQFGTNVEYAKFHQRGTWKMAKRQIVFEPPLFAKKLGRVAGHYVVEGLVPD